MVVLLWCVATVSRTVWQSHQAQIRWQEATTPTPWPDSRARFDWSVVIGTQRVHGMGAMLVGDDGAVQVDLLDPTYVPWLRWVVTSRHVAVYWLSERTHYVGYRSGEVLTDALGGRIPVTTWWQQIATGRASVMEPPTEVGLEPSADGLEVRWSDPPMSAVVNSANVVTSWRFEATRTGTVVTMRPSEDDRYGRPVSVMFEQERPPFRLELSFARWEDVDGQARLTGPLARLDGFEERPMKELPSALFSAILSTL